MTTGGGGRERGEGAHLHSPRLLPNHFLLIFLSCSSSSSSFSISSLLPAVSHPAVQACQNSAQTFPITSTKSRLIGQACDS